MIQINSILMIAVYFNISLRGCSRLTQPKLKEQEQPWDLRVKDPLVLAWFHSPPAIDLLFDLRLIIVFCTHVYEDQPMIRITCGINCAETCICLFNARILYVSYYYCFTYGDVHKNYNYT